MMNGRPTGGIPGQVRTPGRRWYRPLCRRCGRQVEPGWATGREGVPRCRSCHGAELSRSHGQTSFNYSPFRLLGADLRPFTAHE